MVVEKLSHKSATQSHLLRETGAPDDVAECLLNKEQVAGVPNHDLYNTRGDHWNN